MGSDTWKANFTQESFYETLELLENSWKLVRNNLPGG
jgi:hypothetical protein